VATSKRLMDDMFDAYVDWREACRAVDDAYRSWFGATGARTGVTFTRYSVALDREERAAEAYAGLVERTLPRLLVRSAAALRDR
jgi:hypothetical protein